MRLLEHLESLYRSVDREQRLAADPVAFPRRYPDPRDAELAGLVAASFAFGRVDLFRPVLARVLALADARGGPHAYVQGFDIARDGAGLAPIVYRWYRGPDLTLLFASLQRVLADGEGLAGLFPFSAGQDDVGPTLISAMTRLRAIAVNLAPSAGIPATRYAELTHGVKFLLPSPADKSACKRWNMYLRWMVRPTTEGVDLGLWTHIPTRALVVPLDTHVARIARFIGLTQRTDGSWRTALEVTEGLRRLDPVDPIRFDFSIAHLGISGACKGYRDPDVCPACPLYPVCEAT